MEAIWRLYAGYTEAIHWLYPGYRGFRRHPGGIGVLVYRGIRGVYGGYTEATRRLYPGFTQAIPGYTEALHWLYPGYRGFRRHPGGLGGYTHAFYTHFTFFFFYIYIHFYCRIWVKNVIGPEKDHVQVKGICVEEGLPKKAYDS
jgi:hypothetical protein